MFRNSIRLCLALLISLSGSALATEKPTASPKGESAAVKKVSKSKAKRKAKGKFKRQKWPVRRGKPGPSVLPKMGPPTYQPGERLLYDVKMLGAHAGQAILAVGEPTQYEGRDVQPVVGFVRSGEFLNKFYPVENRMVVLLDGESARPLKSDFYINENGKKLNYHTTYNEGKRLVRSVRRKSGRDLRRNFTPATAIYEPLGSVYAARRMNLEAGTTFSYYLWDGRKERHVTITVKDVERVWTQMGWVEATRIELETRISGGFIKKTSLDAPPKRGTVWLGTDEFRTPVKMISPTKLGNAEAVLVRRYHEAPGKAPTLSVNTPTQ